MKGIQHYDRICPDKELAWRAARGIPSYYWATLEGIKLKRVVQYLEKNRIQLYGDYISLARQLGYDLRDDFVAFPRDLRAAHDAALEVRNEGQNRKEREAAKKDDPGIAKIYKKIKKRYTFVSGDFLFRPAASNYEIVKEGQTLHHCVGSGTYKNKMMQGKSYIIFMRKKAEPEKPYYTIEISPDGKILQAFGKYDKKPDWETVEAVIHEYSEKVRERECQKASCRKTRGSAIVAAQTA